MVNVLLVPDKLRKLNSRITCSGMVFLILCRKKNDFMNFGVMSVSYHMNFNNEDLNFHMTHS